MTDLAERCDLRPLLLAFLVSSGAAIAVSGEAPEEQWNRTYGSPKVEWAHSFHQTSDGGYIILGTVNNFSYTVQYPADILVVKTDANGNELWSRTFGEEDDDRAGYIMQTLEGGYLIAWSTENYSAGSSRIWLTKMDAEGKVQWKKDFGALRQYFGGNYMLGGNNVIERSVKETPEGGFLILGRTDTCQGCSGDSWRPQDIWLIKIDPNGNEEWKKTLGRTDKEGYSILVTSDGGLILAGTSSSNVTWFEKFDTDGNRQWNRIYEGLGGTAIIIDESHNGYIAAIQNLEKNSGWRTRLIKTDSNGNLQWQRSSREDYVFNLFLQTSDGGSLLVINDWESDWLLKVDPDGNEQWKKSIWGIAVTSFQQTRDGGYLLGGNKRFSSDNFGGYMLVKIDSHANQQWARTFENELTSGSLFRWAKTAAEIDGGYIVLGTFAQGDMDYDFRLIKLIGGKTPSALFTYEPEYPGVNQTVTLDAGESYDPNGYIVSYLWDFGDGSKENTTNKNISHTYMREEEVTVRLTVMDNDGTENSTFKKISIQKLPSPEETWNRVLGYAGAKYADETEDGGFIIAGEGMTEGMAYSWLLKIDAEGKEQWNRSFRGIGVRSVARTPEGEFIASGDTLPSGDIWIARIDKQGSELWSRMFAGEGFDQAGAISPTADGGFIIAGSYASSNDERSDAWLVKIDSNGTKQWDRRFAGGAGRSMGTDIRQTEDGGYIAAGTRVEIDSTRAWLIKVDSNGNEVWTRTFGTEKLDWGGAVVQAEDGGFLISGTSSYVSYPSTYSDIWLLKTDSKGNEERKKSLFRVNGNAWTDPLFSTGSSYLFSAVVQERPGGYEHAEVFYTIYVKTDANGDVLWRKRENGFSSIRQTSDGGYVIVEGNRLIKLGAAMPEEIPMQSEQTAKVPPGDSSVPGFGWVFAVAGVLAAVYFQLSRKGN